MNSKKFLINIAKSVLVFLFWIGIWFALSFRINSEFLFPSPKSVIQALFELYLTADFWKSAGYSLLRVLLGIIISLVLGTLLAIITKHSKIIHSLLSPLLVIIKTTPVASFIILALLWLDRNILPLFVTSLIVIPIVWSNVTEGIGAVDKDLVEVAKVYRFPTFKKIKKLYIPTAIPYFMAACRSSLGMAWKAGISAEVLSTPKNAIGTELYFSKTYLETPALFAWTLVVILLSVAIEKLIFIGFEHIYHRMHLLPKGVRNDKT